MLNPKRSKLEKFIERKCSACGWTYKVLKIIKKCSVCPDCQKEKNLMIQRIWRIETKINSESDPLEKENLQRQKKALLVEFSKYK